MAKTEGLDAKYVNLKVPILKKIMTKAKNSWYELTNRYFNISKILVNNYLEHKIVYSVGSCSKSSEYEMNTHDFCDKYRTELESHANIPVISRNARFIETSEKTCDVRAFIPDICPLKVRIVDAAVEYSCP